MLPFRKILFPVDYSGPCQAVLPYVQEMACRFSAELTACHAYAPVDAAADSELLTAHPELRAKAEALEKDRLRQFVCQGLPGLEIEAMVEVGDPVSIIDRLAQQQQADLVMLATRGHGPVRRFLMGSMTAKVLHDVSAVVWTGVGAALADHPVRIPYRSIVCALDDSEEAEAVLRGAASLASAYRAQLWILNVLPAQPTQQLREASQFRLRELKAKAGVDAPHAVIDAQLADGIQQEVVRRRADLLVTGRGHSTGTFGLMWSHLYSIIRDSPCPVLSI